MMADRLSYFFQIKGPSYVADTACNSFMIALDHAFKAIRNGRCDKALVASGNILLHPGPTLQYYQ
jgi:fatty acid synthase